MTEDARLLGSLRGLPGRVGQILLAPRAALARVDRAGRGRHGRAVARRARDADLPVPAAASRRCWASPSRRWTRSCASSPSSRTRSWPRPGSCCPRPSLVTAARGRAARFVARSRARRRLLRAVLRGQRRLSRRRGRDGRAHVAGGRRHVVAGAAALPALRARRARRAAAARASFPAPDVVAARARGASSRALAVAGVAAVALAGNAVWSSRHLRRAHARAPGASRRPTSRSRASTASRARSPRVAARARSSCSTSGRRTARPAA